MCPNHSVAQDGWEVDLYIVEDPINEIGGVIHQHTLICGRKYVVSEYSVKNLDNGPTLLVRKSVGPVEELLA